MPAALLDALFTNLCTLVALALLTSALERPGGAWSRLAQVALHALTGLLLAHHLTVPGLTAVPVAVLAVRLGAGWALLAALPIVAAQLRWGAPAALTEGVALVLAAALGALMHAWERRGTEGEGGHHANRAWWPPLLLFAVTTPLALLTSPSWRALPPAQAALSALALTLASAGGFQAWRAVRRAFARGRLRDATQRTLAYLDALTGLPNRRAFDRDWSQRPEGSWLLLMDIDHFKRLNDTHGHALGDQVLRAFGQVCRDSLRRTDRAYRIGGEEFVVLLPRVRAEDARLVAERLRQQVRAVPGLAGRPTLTFSFSGGLTPATEGALARADRLLYAAKAAGRDRVLSELPSEAPPQPDLPRGPQPAPDAPTSAWATVRSFLTFLARSEGEPSMQDLLTAAVATVPGAQAGSVAVRCAQGVVTTAQVGFDDGLLGSVHSTEDMLHWHGDAAACRAGRPRVASGAALRKRAGSRAMTGEQQQLFSTAGRRGDLQANLVLPIVVDGEVIAELNLDNLEDTEAFTPLSLQVAEEFGLLVAAALATSQRLQRERDTREGALFALGVALEARDHETQGHTQRVVQLSGALGEALGLTTHELEALRQGAYLHDLGKLQVPDSILLKPGKLTDEEMQTIRAHANIGAKLAAYLPGLEPRALEVIRSHHERWDGRGYPDGLYGERIPRLARIFAVCDVYDALTSERPYKKAWTHHAALQEVQAQSGHHFDPEVVAAFVKLLPAPQDAAQDQPAVR